MTLDELKALTKENDSGCWIWQRSRSSSGYGQITIKKKYWTTHRLAYFIVNGPIPEGLYIRHSCHTRECCNPQHLLSGSAKDNYHDSVAVHLKAAKKQRNSWLIDGISFGSLRETSRQTGISQHSLCKFTRNGVFQIDEYRAACKIAGWKPKV